MNHELLKELMDAGFPKIYINRDITLSVPYVPTLSELIDATVSLVPDKFLDITSRDYRPEQWVATSSWEIKSGSTPEEAVARLWLALNKKV